jgi:peptidoglycan/xylan/chitin deacetylase (PgdA/CDA1 family)
MNSDRSVAVLAFHKIGRPPPGETPTWFYIPEEIFAAQLAILEEEQCTVIDLARFVRGLTVPETLPARPGLITFDDGCRSLTDAALRCLLRFRFPAVVFVPSDYVGRTNVFDRGIEPEEPISDWNDLDRLQRAGVSVQSHSASHRPFSNLSTSEQHAELAQSKSALEHALGSTVTAFAYPYGDGGNDPAATARLLGQTGYEAAFLYGGGLLHLGGFDPYRLPRIAMGPDTNLRTELFPKK